MAEKVRCKKEIWDRSVWNSHQCTRYAVEDGYCRIHHPDAEEKRRKESDKRWEQNERRTALFMLHKAGFGDVVGKLRMANDSIRYFNTLVKSSRELQKAFGLKGKSSFPSYRRIIVIPEIKKP